MESAESYTALQRLEMAIIICEGPDGSGKTTLAKNFSHYEYIHNGAFETSDKAFNAYVNQIDKLTPQSNVFVDRMHISERIYGTIYHGFNMDDSKYYHVDNLLNQLGAIVLLCIPPYEVALSNWKSRLHEEMLSDEDIFKQIYQRYEAMVYSSRFARLLTAMPIVIYNYKDPIDLTEMF